MINKLLTVAVADEELEGLEQHCQQFNLTQTEVIREHLRTLNQHPEPLTAELSKEELLSEISHLRRKLAEVEQEKSDLEIILQTTAEHSCLVEAELQDEAEEARRESEEWFQAITAATPVPVLLSRLSDGEILYANAIASSTLGLPIQELIGCQSTDFFYNPSHRQKLLDILARDGRLQNHEIRAKKADGTPFWVSISLKMLLFKGESTILSAWCDITDRKQAEEKLAQAKEQLKAVLDAVPGSISWVGADGLYLGVNQYLAQSVKMSPDAFIGQEVGFLNTNSKFAEFMRQFLASSEMAASQEIKVQVKDSVLYYLMVVQKYQQGNATVTVGIDITERKQAEEALRIAEENYRSIFENALEGIFQSTPDGHFISVNPAMARIYGYSCAEEMIASVTQISRQIYVNPQGRDELQHLLDEYGEVKDWEYQVYRQDGSLIWVEENTRTVRDSSGKLLYYEGIIQDITKRKQEEAALKLQVQELRIEIDHQKRSREVAQITQSDYFQQLKAAAEHLRMEDDFF